MSSKIFNSIYIGFKMGSTEHPLSIVSFLLESYWPALFTLITLHLQCLSNSKTCLRELIKTIFKSKYDTNFFSIQVKWSAYSNAAPSNGDLGVQLASSGYFKSYDEVDGSMQNQLNNASPSFKGAIFRIKKKGEYHYMCTRNNNFSNRSQKGSFIVK